MDAISGDLIASWRRMPTEWHRGLTAEEIGAAEKRFDFEFPPDLRKLLQIQMPAGDGYPDWRDPETVVTQFEWPWEGIRYDIEYGEFWLIAWGSRPAALADALSIARRHFNEAPKLVPVYGHRYMPVRPIESDNPILSVYQTDVIYYGLNLKDWMRIEFGGGEAVGDLQVYKRIPFWTEVIESV